MLQFFSREQIEEIIQRIAKDLGIDPEDVRNDAKLIENYVKKQCENDKEEIIEL